MRSVAFSAFVGLLLVSCNLTDSRAPDAERTVQIVPRIQLSEGMSLPVTDFVHVRLTSSSPSKVWYDSILPWSSKFVNISGVPVGTEFTLLMEGKSSQIDGSQAVWWSGSQSGTASDTQTVKAQVLTVPVSVKDTTRPVITGPNDTVLEYATAGVRLRWTVKDGNLAKVTASGGRVLSIATDGSVTDTIAVKAGAFLFDTLKAIDSVGNVSRSIVKVGRKDSSMLPSVPEKSTKTDSVIVLDSLLLGLGFSHGTTVPAVFDTTLRHVADTVDDTVSTLILRLTVRGALAVILDTVDLSYLVPGQKRTIVLKVPQGQDTVRYTLDLPVKATAATGSDAFPWNTKVTYGSVLDDRDGQVYKTVKIGTQTWFAENLRYSNGGTLGQCFLLDSSYCRKYGRFYTWAEAMNVNLGYNSAALDAKYSKQGACPTGWHLPTFKEWLRLADTTLTAAVAGFNLRSSGGWPKNNGSDSLGFRIIPAEMRVTGTTYYGPIDRTFLRSSDQSPYLTSSQAYIVGFSTISSNVNRQNDGGKSSKLPVRCIKN